MILDIILTSFFGVAIFYAHIFLKNMIQIFFQDNRLVLVKKQENQLEIVRKEVKQLKLVLKQTNQQGITEKQLNIVKKQ